MNDEFEKVKNLVERQVNFDKVNVEFKNFKTLSIRGLSFKNPILKATLQSSILSNVSRGFSRQKIEELRSFHKNAENNKKAKEMFEEKFRDGVIQIIINSLKDKLDSEDLPTPISPTSVASSEIPNYYISEPRESYAQSIKIELLNKLLSTICGRCGDHIYGLYIPEEGNDLREILKDYTFDFINISVGSIAGVGKLNLQEIEPFEYLFYILDRPLQDMHRRNIVPIHHVELFVAEGIGRGKKFFSHYIIPNLNEVFYKLYYGSDKYSSGRSKIKALVSSFLVENWNIEDNQKRKVSKKAHWHINKFLYYLFCHKILNMDSIIFLEDLKIKMGDTTPIMFLDEVVSWM
jgi:hypothetical protein